MNASSRPLKVAITGGTGFIGSHVIPRLQEQGYTCLRLERSVDGVETEGRVSWELSSSVSQMRAALTGVSAIMHIAAYIPSNMNDISQIDRCLELNTLGTTRLLEAAVLAGVEHFIYASTAALYAPGLEKVSEDSPLYPGRALAYLTSKLAAETCVSYFGKTTPMNCTILRLASVYGPGMSSSGLIPCCLEKLRKEGVFEVADGDRYRTDLVSVHDVAQAFCAALRAGGGNTFSIGSGELVSPARVARIIAANLGKTEGVVRVLAASSGKPPECYGELDISRASSVLGYVPTPLERGLADYVRFCGR